MDLLNKQVMEYWQKYPIGSLLDNFEYKRALLEKEHNMQKYYDLIDDSNVILDGGCGNGFVLKSIGADAKVGIDVSLSALKVAKERLQGEAELVHGDLSALPFRSLVFDAMTSFGVIHHIPLWKDSLAEIDRCLRNRGIILLLLYHTRSLFPRVASFFTHRSPKDLLKRYDGTYNPYTRSFRRKEVKNVFPGYELNFDIRYLTKGMLPIFGRFIPSFILKIVGRFLGFYLYVYGVKGLVSFP